MLICCVETVTKSSLTYRLPLMIRSSPIIAPPAVLNDAALTSPASPSSVIDAFVVPSISNVSEILTSCGNPIVADEPSPAV